MNNTPDVVPASSLASRTFPLPAAWAGDFRQAYAKVVSLAYLHHCSELVPRYRKEVEHFWEQQGYGVGEEQWKRLFHLLKLIPIAVEELELGLVSVSAILFYDPIYRQTVHLSDVEPFLPTGTTELLHLLLDTSEVYLRHKSLSGEELQPFLLSVARDVRVVLLLIGERLLALRTAKEQLSTEEQYQLAIEVQGLFVPLAHRLGLYAIKGEMEDLVLKYTDPSHFYLIKTKLGETKRVRNEYLERFLAPLKLKLNSAERNWPYEIKARTKSISSIHNKMVNKGVAFENIYDLTAIRIILDTPPEEEREACWYVYSIVTDAFPPDIKRLRDWITRPKENGYESLQITVEGPEGKSVEVQIRTRRMDNIAERGMAAHWRYKGVASQAEIDATLTSVRQALESVKAKNLIKDDKAIDLNLSDRMIFVFTPTGELLKLPAGATVLDFAFAIHSRIGSTAQSALINNRKARLRDRLHNGDTVSIQTAKNQRPSVDWLNFVVTRRAKNKIRQLLREQQEKGLDAAKELLERKFRNRRLEYNEAVFSHLVRKMGFKGNMEFFIALSEERINVTRFIDDYQEAFRSQQQNTLHPDATSEQPRKEAAKSTSVKQQEVVIVAPELDGVEYSMAQCCTPRLGDEIFAYPTKQGIRIHSKYCPNALDILGRHGDRVLPARWRDLQTDRLTYRVRVTACNEPPLRAKVFSLCQLGTGLELLSQEQHESGDIWNAIFTIAAFQPQDIHALVAKLQALKGVQQAELELSLA